MTEPAALIATSQPDSPERDLPSTVPDPTFRAWASPRRRILAGGCAMRISVPAPWPENLDVVSHALASIGCDDPSDVIALGALPFETDQPATLVVPRHIRLVTTEGERRQIHISGPDRAGADRPVTDQPGTDQPSPAQAPTGAAPPHPLRITAQSVQEPSEWMDLVEQATQRIQAGELTKVVLARALDVEADVNLDPQQVWQRLDTQHPGSYRYAMDGFVGASPELLVSRSGSTVRAHPMAGTTARTGDPELDQRRAGELLASAKNQTEHMITIDAVMDALLDSCSYLDSEPSPSIVAAGPVQHLATLVEGRLSSPEPDVLRLVAALHPTPAVGGHPRDAAERVRKDLETVPRGLYAGPVGWVDASGDGAFAVGIRSVQINQNHARLFAGVGVVADSDPLAELAETRAKAQTLLNVLVRL